MLQGVSPSDLASGAQVIEALVVVVSLVFIAAQLRQTTELAKAENARQLTSHTLAFNATLYQDPKLIALWYGFGRQFDALEPIDRLRYREMLTQWLLLHMNIYFQWKRGLLAPEIYHAWQGDLRLTATRHNLNVVAKDITEFFPGPFGQELLRLQREGTVTPRDTAEGLSGRDSFR